MVLGLQAHNVLKIMQVTVSVKVRKLGWVSRGVRGWLCSQASQALPIAAGRAQLDLPLALSSACWGGSTPQGACPLHECHHLCSSPGRFPSLQRLCSELCRLSAACHEGVTKLVTLRQSIQINFFYKPIKLDKSIKPQPTFEYRFVLQSRIGTTRLFKFSRF